MALKRKDKKSNKSDKSKEKEIRAHPLPDVDELVQFQSDQEDQEEAAAEIENAIVDYADALDYRLHNSKDEDEEDGLDDAASDSSEEERPQRNTVGAVPLEWYSDEEHIGYDAEGKKIIKKEKKDKLSQLLDKTDSSTAWRTVYDKYNDEEIVLTKEEMRMIQNIRVGRFPHADIDPFAEENDWFTRHTEVMPLSAAPEPKRRFIPSKWEEKKVVKLVRAMRKGWLTREKAPKKPDAYLLWSEDGDASNKTLAGLTYLAAPKMKLPGHEESYNPPEEYLMSKEEEHAAKLEAEENDDPPPFIPKLYDALRKVPAYERYINERFERCLDLYLCPRSQIKRMDISDPESLVPKLPKPKDLQPFPTILSITYKGHSSLVNSLSVNNSGQWMLSGSKDKTVKMWEVSSGRCMVTWTLESPVHRVAWCPGKKFSLFAVSSGSSVFLIPVKIDGTFEETSEFLSSCIHLSNQQEQNPVSTWLSKSIDSTRGMVDCVEIKHDYEVKDVSWHNGGDYFCSICPKGNTRSVLVHQLSKGQSQNPFRKNRGIVSRALFHPTKPFFFVATQQAVRVYNLAKQSLAKKLVAGSGVITSMSIHPSGDHVLLGGEDRRVCWYDLDLSSKPYKALRYHEHAVRSVSFHPTYPLFASSSDDGTAHIFHGRVFSDLMTNPMIVPVKILKGHDRIDAAGVLSVVFHPKQPWAFTAGADGNIFLFVNP